MYFLNNFLSKIQPIFYLRESQLARLFVTAFNELKDIKE